METKLMMNGQHGSDCQREQVSMTVPVTSASTSCGSFQGRPFRNLVSAYLGERRTCEMAIFHQLSSIIRSSILLNVLLITPRS